MKEQDDIREKDLDDFIRKWHGSDFQGIDEPEFRNLVSNSVGFAHYHVAMCLERFVTKLLRDLGLN